MLAEMIDKIVSLAEAKTFEIDGETYSNKSLVRVPPHVDRPREVSVSSLDSIVKLIRAEKEKIGRTIMVEVNRYNQVTVFSTFLDDFSRYVLYQATADTPDFREGWRKYEDAVIELRSIFFPNEGTEYLLSLLSSMSNQNTVKTTDNGVTQQVEARQGVSLNALVSVKPRVTLCPFRTFLEVAQPDSEFVLRVDADKGIGLFEADGGVWKLVAKKNIADYLSERLAVEIESGEVIVME